MVLKPTILKSGNHTGLDFQMCTRTLCMNLSNRLRRNPIANPFGPSCHAQPLVVLQRSQTEASFLDPKELEFFLGAR